MQVFVETTSGLGRRLTIELPADKIDQAVQKRINEIAKTAKIDGFRPGKVPQRVLQQRYGESVRQEILGNQLQESFVAAVTKESLRPAGQPEIKIKQFEKDKPLIYEAFFEVYPEINLVDLHDVEVEQYTAELTETDFDNALEKIRKQNAEWQDVSRAAKNGDQVVVDFDGYIDNKAFAGGKAENVPLTLGSKTMISGFEDGIIGMQTEEEKSITVSFPADYHNKDVAGKQAEFKIKLHKVAQAHLPELNDKFAEKLGIKEGGIQKLHAQLREKMQENLQASLEMKNKTAVLDKMLEMNKIEIPNALIENETEALREQFMNQFSQQLSKDQQPAIDKAIFKEQAIKRVSLGLLIAEVVKKYDIKPDEIQVRKIVEDLAASHDDPEKVINWYMSDKKHLQHFEQINTEDQVVAKLLEGAKIKEKKLNFDEVVKHE